MRKNKTPVGVFGVILILIGLLGTIPLSLNKALYALSITTAMVIVGVLLVAWAFTD